MIRIAVVGARGRMGRTVVQLAGEQGIDVALADVLRMLSDGAP